MEGKGPFLWLNPYAPPSGFRQVPYGGMCLSAFLFLRRGRKLLLGKHREHPAWETLAGMKANRVREQKDRWTLPARQLRLGEDPREAARQIGEEILGLKGIKYGEPRAETEYWLLGDDAWGPPERRNEFHYDVWFLVDGALARNREVKLPPWYSELAWVDPQSLREADWGKFHGDVVARWKQGRRRAGR